MTEAIMPKNANEWATFLVSKPLPSPFKVGKAVLRKIQGNTIPYVDIAARINSDPILSFGILSYANKHRAEGTESSKTLAHAISMVGIEQLTTMINELPFKALSISDITSFYYLRTMVTSLFAGHLARAISLKKSKGNSEDIYWSGLFLNAPTWYLWRFATPEMRLVRYAIRSNFKLPHIAEKEVLGDTVEDVTRAIAAEITLPDLAQSCYEPEKQLSKKQWVKIARTVPDKGKPFPIEDRYISLKMQTPQFVVMLANLISHEASSCWYSRATLRAQRILAGYLQCPLDEAIRLTHETAAQMSRAHPMPGLMLPAARIFIPPRKRTKALEEHPQLNDNKVKAIKPASPSNDSMTSDSLTNDSLTKESPTADSLTNNASKENTLEDVRKQKTKNESNAIFNELIAIMQNRPEDFTDLHELMNAATQGIAYGIELKRSFVGLISNNGSRFKNYYSVGCQDQEDLANFESQIVRGTIFEKLAARPASIWVKPSSDKKVLQLIPMNFTHVIDTEEYFLMSVFVGKKPVAIFYADNYQGESLSEWHYQQFKHMCSAVSTALQHQAKNKNRA